MVLSESDAWSGGPRKDVLFGEGGMVELADEDRCCLLCFSIWSMRDSTSLPEDMRCADRAG